MNSLPIVSNALKDRPQFVVLVDDKPAVYSIHVTEYDAKHNARIVDGIVMPLDWVGDKMVLPVWRKPQGK
jgi:hypothetical protein